MADVKQTKKIVPLIACEIPSWHNICKLVFGVDMLDLDFGSKLILSDTQSSATLWVLDTCLIVGLRPLMIILITASLSSKDEQHRTKQRKLRVRRDTVNIVQTKIVVLGWNLGFVLGVLV